MMHRHDKQARALVFGLLFLSGIALAGDPETVFTHPPEFARPGVWWHWMGCNVTAEGITRDLEAFKDAGIGGATLFGMADVCTPWAGHIDNSPTDGLIAFTDSWWQLVRHAASEAKRLGLDLGIHNCPGYTHSGGPWIPPELSMQELCFSQTAVDAAARFDGKLPRPTVDPRAHMHFPVVNKDTGQLEKPVIEGRRTFYRDIAVLALPAEGVVAVDQVVDLTPKMRADGTLDWAPPAGRWVTYRIGHTTMGSMTQPNQWEIRGLESDKMSAVATAFHLDHVLGDINRHLGALVGTGLKHVLFDSYEAGTPSWTPKMPEEFLARRGYDLTPFLATFVGRVVGSEADTKRFKRDFGQTIADLYRDVHFAIVSRRLGKVGLRFECEPYGGPFRTGDVAPYVHRVMTEFWTSGGAFRGGVQGGIMNAADGQRHNILQAEAFTGAPEESRWTEHPAWLKPVGDGAFLAGINRLVLHHCVLQPWDDRYRPGNTMGRWGTHFGRLQTWWDPGKAWITYLQRCQAMLQWGAPTDGAMVVEAIRGNLQVNSLRRTEGGTDVFFMVNQACEDGQARCVFPVMGKQPELWDPVTGAMRDLVNVETEGGESVLTLDFAPGQSFLIVFRKPSREAGSGPRLADFPKLGPVATLGSTWEVSFDPAWGGPGRVTFDKLEDWTKRPEPGIKYYSGTAVYRSTFSATPERSKALIQLDLGIVRHLARVRINGRDLGVVWCAPWRVRIPPGVLKTSGNILEIEVTNVWANRLIGDEQASADCEWQPGHMGGSYLKQFPDWFVKAHDRPSSDRYCFTTWNYFSKDSELTSSGLLGPVRLLAEDWTHVDPKWPEATVRIRTGTSFEGDVLKEGLARIASMTETCVAHAGGGSNADALVNGTTRNGSDGNDTIDDGETFRGYGDGSVLTVLFESPHDLSGIRTFAGHADRRAGQSYRVLAACVGAPGRFDLLESVSANCAGGASEVRIRLERKAVTALRFEFRNGPLGFNVYRELNIIGAPTVPAGDGVLLNDRE